MIDGGVSQTNTAVHYSRGASTAAGARSTPAASTAAGTATYGDSVSISDEARKMQAEALEAQAAGDSVAASAAAVKAKAVTASRLRKYMNVGMGYGETNLTAMNFSRKSIGGKIENILKSAGIKLGKDDKLTIKVGADDKIIVGGIKDKDKVKAIEEALNDDRKLGREMRNHVAAAKVTENAQKQQEYEDYLTANGMEIPEDTGELFTHVGVRAFAMDGYIQDEYGVSLADLSLEYDEFGNKYIAGIPKRANATEYTELGASLFSILENNEAAAEFGVTFEYANGALSDPNSMEMAKSKIQGVKAKLMDEWDPETQSFTDGVIDVFRKRLESMGGEYEEEFMQALSRSFSIRVDPSGGFELVGGENMSGKLKEVLTGLVQKSLDLWAGDATDAMDGGGVRVANFADVFDTYIEEHQFEHGDTREHKHNIEIDFGGSGVADVRVVSPDADKAQDAKNQQVAGELGESLRAMLGENGIDASNLQMQVDEKGKITVLGDPSNPDVEKAQSLLDAFTQGVKVEGKAAAGERDEGPLRLDQEEDDEFIPAGYVKRDIVAHGDRERELSPEEQEEKRDAHYARIYTEADRQADVLENWADAMQKNNHDKYLSLIGKARGPFGGRAMFADAGVGGGSSAKSLYRELMNGMTGFHDERRGIQYAM